MLETDRDKLIKILRMFSSDHDGEVAAAARRAHKIIRDRSLDWDDLIIPVGARTHGQEYRERASTKDTPDNDEADLIRKCAELNKCLSQWEREFITSIGESIVEWGKLTVKQKSVLDRIINKLKVQGNWEDI